VIGGGAWGLGLAAAAARSGTRVLLQSRRDLTGHLPSGVRQAEDLAEVAREARLIVLAVPSHVARDVARHLGDAIDGRHLVVHGIRGLADKDLVSISSILREETPARRVGALGGPILAEDLLAGRPCVLVCGSHYPEVNDAVTATFAGPALRVYASDDLPGIEWASALVGCLAIAVGFGQEVGLHAGLIATLVSRGVEEAARIAASAGGDERTLLGLAGYGDLLASISQRERPEVLVGAALARGKTVAEAVAEAKERVEAVELLPRIAAWADAHGVNVPIFRALAARMLGGHAAGDIVHELMITPPQRLH